MSTEIKYKLVPMLYLNGDAYSLEEKYDIFICSIGKELCELSKKISSNTYGKGEAIDLAKTFNDAGFRHEIKSSYLGSGEDYYYSEMKVYSVFNNY